MRNRQPRRILNYADQRSAADLGERDVTGNNGHYEQDGEVKT
jgi:hypothetical protein